MNCHEEMARAACDALGLKFEETSPAEIKARVYEMWDGLNAKLNPPSLDPIAVDPENPEMRVAVYETLRCPKFRAVEWKPEDRDRRLRELVKLFDGRIVYGESGKMILKGMTALTIGRIDDLIQREFPGSGPPLFTDEPRLPALPFSQRIPDGTADRV